MMRVNPSRATESLLRNMVLPLQTSAVFLLFIVIVCIYTSFYLQPKGKSGFPKPRKILLQSGFNVEYVSLICE